MTKSSINYNEDDDNDNDNNHNNNSNNSNKIKLNYKTEGFTNIVALDLNDEIDVTTRTKMMSANDEDSANSILKIINAKTVTIQMENKPNSCVNLNRSSSLPSIPEKLLHPVPVDPKYFSIQNTSHNKADNLKIYVQKHNNDNKNAFFDYSKYNYNNNNNNNSGSEDNSSMEDNATMLINNADNNNVGKQQNKFIEISRKVLDMNSVAELAGGGIMKEPKAIKETATTTENHFQWRKFLRNKNRKFHDCSSYEFFSSFIPILEWLPKYSIRSCLGPDIVAGITVSILHVPQGIAYSMLAGLDPVYGLYVSFFPVLIYAILGTSPHISVGTFAIASIMLNNIATKRIGALNGQHHHHFHHNQHNLPNDSMIDAFITTDSSLNENIKQSDGLTSTPTTLEVLTSVGLLCGLIQIMMGLLRLGSLSLILSEQLVSAFSSAVAFHVATSQLSSIFGFTNLPLSRTIGPFKLIKTWIILLNHLKDANVYCLVFSILSILILIISNEFVEPKLKKRYCSTLPLPIDVILVITSIIVSWSIKFNQKFSIQVVGNVPTGLPKPTVPRFDLMPSLFIDTMELSIVCFVVSLSVAKIFAKKHGNIIRANQELLALGSANVFSSFFLAYPASAALSRSTLQEKSGGKTQIVGLISSAIILTVLLFLAPFLYHLPKFTLSCIVLVALKSMFLRISDVKIYWNISKLDGTSWIITFLSVIILDIDYGFIIGVFTAILVIIIKVACPRISALGNLASTEIYMEKEDYNHLFEYPYIKIFRFNSPLFYLNVDSFREKIMMSIQTAQETQINPTKTVILDLSGVSFIDKTGLDVLIEVVKTLQNKQINCCLTQCPLHIIKSLKNVNFFEKVKHPKNVCQLYPTNHDAVINFY